MLVVIVVLALLNFFGVRTRTVSASGDDIALDVTYAQISRPGLAIDLDRAHHRGGCGTTPVRTHAAHDTPTTSSSSTRTV